MGGVPKIVVAVSLAIVEDDKVDKDETGEEHTYHYHTSINQSNK